MILALVVVDGKVVLVVVVEGVLDCVVGSVVVSFVVVGGVAVCVVVACVLVVVSRFRQRPSLSTRPSEQKSCLHFLAKGSYSWPCVHVTFWPTVPPSPESFKSNRRDNAEGLNSFEFAKLRNETPVLLQTSSPGRAWLHTAQ